jgi:hypothetical protein
VSEFAHMSRDILEYLRLGTLNMNNGALLVLLTVRSASTEINSVISAL